MNADAKPLDAERARLRAQGYTDAEISQVLVARAAGAGASPSQPAPAAAGPGVGGQGVMSAVVSSFVAVMAYVRGTLPAIKNDCVILVSGSASAAARAKAGGSLLIRAALVLVIAYAVRAEWQQHIISATDTAAAQAEKSKADAAVAAATARGGTMPLPKSFNAPDVSIFDEDRPRARH